jgi:hypothetical protein
MDSHTGLIISCMLHNSLCSVVWYWSNFVCLVSVFCVCCVYSVSVLHTGNGMHNVDNSDTESDGKSNKGKRHDCNPGIGYCMQCEMLFTC